MEFVYVYIICGFVCAVWSFCWSYPDVKVPISAYFWIIIVWPYQLYLQWRYKNDQKK